MLFKDITILNSKMEVETHMYVGVDQDKIKYIGKEMPEENFGEEYNGKGKLLMAGFYNSHAHSPMALMRGYGENLVLQDWLNKKIFPFEGKLDGNAVYWGTLLSMAESIRFGIVSSTDMYYFVEDMAKAVADSGAKSNISRSIVNFAGEDLFKMDSMIEMQQAVKNIHNTQNGKILIDASLHGEYTSDEKTARALAEYTKEIGLNMHVHVSETRLEHEECKERHNGLTPVQYLNKCRIFDTHTVAAHCVWVEGEDFDIIKEKDVTVASNPISNLKLASGICNVPKFLSMGVNVALGTDSVASNNSLNFLEEVKAVALLAKEKSKDPTVVTPKEAIVAATYGGAYGQGRMDCGKMQEGYKADLIVLDINQPNMFPVHNLLNNIVYSASGSDIVLTMVDGKVLYKDGEYMTIDLEKTIFEANKATSKILEQL